MRFAKKQRPGKLFAEVVTAMPRRIEVMKKPHCKYCDFCKKRLKREEGIRIGWSVMCGVLKVCDSKCLDRLNSYRPSWEKTANAEGE